MPAATQVGIIHLIDSPGMDWLVDDTSYAQFMTLELECENRLKQEFAALAEPRKCKTLLW